MAKRLDSSICRVTILSKNAKYLETKVESQYGTEYHVDRISESLIAQWQVIKIFLLIVIINTVQYETKTKHHLHP